MNRRKFTEHRLYNGLALLALALGALAMVAGSPIAAANARVDVTGLAKTIEQEDDHVTAVELAGWIRDRRQGLRIIDVRDSAEFRDYHIPGAESVALTNLASTRFGRDETIVLYSDGGAHAAQAWVFLRSLGYTRVFFLRGGLVEWLDQVMNPTLSTKATDSAREEFKKVSDISRYFGGVPRVGDPIPEAHGRAGNQKTATAQSALAVSRVRGRGC